MIKKISEIVLNDNRRKVDAAKVKELAESIKQLGLINPITINSNNVLIAGNHRLEAFKLLGKDEIEVSVLELNNLLAELAEIDENLVRNELHWTDADKQIARRKAIYLQLYPETAKGIAGGIAGGNGRVKVATDNLSFAKTTAKITSQSERTVERAVKRGEEITEEEAEVLKTIDAPKSYGDILIKQTTETRAKVIDALKVESKPVEIIIQEIKKEEKKEERLQKIELIKESIEKENKTLEGVFDVIAIDPPWEYSERGGFSSEQHDEDSNRGGVDYPTLTVEELKLLKLPSKDDCVLYLWTTHAFLRDSFDLLNAWGFTYKAVITWDKEKMGIGRNIRMQCEFCLLATKGNPLLQGSSVRDIIREPRREHSRKPIKFYELVETMTTGRKLDYFSREKRENWEVYGAESEKF